MNKAKDSWKQQAHKHKDENSKNNLIGGVTFQLHSVWISIVCFNIWKVMTLFINSSQLPQEATARRERVKFQPLSPQEFLVLIWLTMERWKAESTLEPRSGFEPGTHELGIQHPNHCHWSITIYNFLMGIGLLMFVESSGFFAGFFSKFEIQADK